MKRTGFIFLICILQSFHSPAQRDTLTREMIIGTWTEYQVTDTTKYLAIPDSLKNYETIGAVSSFISNIYYFYADGTYKFYVGLSGVEMGTEGTWSVSNDTLILHDNEWARSGPVPMRCIDARRMEYVVTYVGEADTAGERQYWFFEKWP